MTESLGRKKANKNVWITEGTWEKIDGMWEKIEERKATKDKLNSSKTCAMKARYQQQYSAIHKKVKVRARQDKRYYYKGLVREAEGAAEQRDLREQYQLTRVLPGKKSPLDRSIKCKSSNILSSKEEQQKRWVDHFTEILNREPPHTLADIPAAECTIKLRSVAPMKEEIREAVMSLRK